MPDSYTFEELQEEPKSYSFEEIQDQPKSYTFEDLQQDTDKSQVIKLEPATPASRIAPMGFIPPPSEELASKVISAPMRAIGTTVAGLGRAARDLLTPTTWLPAGEKPQAPFVLPLGEGQIRPRTPTEMAAAEPLQAGKPLYEPSGTALSPEGNELERLLSRWSTPEAMAVLPASTTKAGAALLFTSMVPGLVGQIKDAISGTGSDQEKRDRVNDLVSLAALVIAGKAKPRIRETAEPTPAKAKPLEPEAPPAAPTGGALLRTAPEGKAEPVEALKPTTEPSAISQSKPEEQKAQVVATPTPPAAEVGKGEAQPLNWQKTPSVTPGGKKFFWTAKTDDGVVRVVWNRLRNKWSAQDANGNSIGEFDTEKQGKAAVEQAIAKPKEPTIAAPAPGTKEGMTGMGGAVPSEFQTSGRTQTSIKNAVVDKERLERGEKPMMDVIRRGREDVWQKAMSILDRDPMAREKLVADLRAKPRAIDDYEVALLDHYRVDLKNEYAKATRQAAQAADDGRLQDVERFNSQSNMWSDKLLELEEAAGKGGAGTETARGLAYRRWMVNDDFTLAALELQKRKDNGYRQLTPDERAQLIAQADAHKAKADAYEQRIKELESERDAKEIAEALAKAKREAEPKHPPVVIQLAEQIVASWDKRADAARARIKERMSRMSAGVDPTLILDLAEVGLSHVGHIALDAAKFGEKLRTEFGDWVTPHIESAWQKVQELIEKEKKKAVPGTPRAKAIEKITTPEAATDDLGVLSKKIQKKLGGKDEGDISYLTRKVARYFVEQGVKHRDQLITSVQKVLAQFIPEITRRETMDAISGYGKFTPLSKDAASVVLRDLSGQMQQISKLEDMAAGVAPSKTGFARRTPSDIERGLIKQVEAAKKAGGYQVTDPETQLRTAMQAVHTRLQNQIKDLETQIANREKIVKEPRKLVYDAKANQLKARRDELMEQFNAMFPKTPITEAERLAAWKQRVIERTKDMKERLAAGDFSKKPSRPPVQLDNEAMRLRFDMHTIERQIREGRESDLRRQQSYAKKGLRYAGEIINTFRALKTSYDLSAVLRQGGFIAFGHPVRAAKSFPAMFKALLSEKGQFATAEEIRNRPNAPLYEQAKLYLAEHGGRLSRMEEVYMSRWAEKIPGVRASERAYITFLNKLRADSFDAMAATLSPNGKLSLPQAKILANYINVATGRGSVGLDQAAVALNTAFFAPRYVVSRFQLLSGQPLWGGGEIKGQAKVRALIAAEYARFLAGAAVVYTLGMAAGATVETDPRSADFGKLKIGNTRIDPMAGLLQSTVLTSRLVSGSTKTAGGQVVPIRGNVPYGHSDAADVVARFVRSKLNPAVGETINIASGKDVVGNPVTPQSIPSRLISPIGVVDIYQAMLSEGIPAGTALAMLSIFGMGLQTYTPKPTAAKLPSFNTILQEQNR